MRQERNVWAHLEDRFERQNIPGRIRRIEEKGRAGFVDVLMCVHGVTHFIELKHVEEYYDRAFHRKAPYGLLGSQALELDAWAKAGAPAVLLVCFGLVSRVRVPGDTTFALWHGEKVLDFFREDAREIPLAPDRVYQGTFDWHAYLHHIS